MKISFLRRLLRALRFRRNISLWLSDRAVHGCASLVINPVTVASAAAEATVTGFMTRLAHPWTARSLSQREMFLRNLRALRSRRKKLIFILGDIFPSVGFMKKRYGCRTWLTAFLFYPHRLGKIPWILGLLKSNNYDN